MFTFTAMGRRSSNFGSLTFKPVNGSILAGKLLGPYATGVGVCVGVGVSVIVGVSVGVFVRVTDGLGVLVLTVGCAVGEAVGKLIICPHPANRNMSTNPRKTFLIILPSVTKSNGNHTAFDHICQLLAQNRNPY
jgi:hypothetical protein